MDLTITIKDENGEELGSTNIYQDGSDSEGAKEIILWIEDNYSTDPSGSVLKLSGGINWEARDEQVRDRNKRDSGTPPEGHPFLGSGGYPGKEG